MSDIIKCDKCGEELPKKIQRKYNFFSVLRREHTEKYFSFILDRTIEKTIEKKFHLCKKCNEKLEMWLNNEI